ncbi:MAG TPA: hypothetical protein VLU41_10705 [Ideonella sp.]|nr:hypothetical protein [Ideonella sp.]
MQPDAGRAQPDLNEIYRQLKRGVGRQWVTDANVFALIDIAVLDGNRMLATELREWQAPCSDGSEGVPSTIAPTRGFNRENAKR